MKKFLFLVLFLLFSLFGYSQNGGQFFENNVIKIFYLGYSNDLHTFKVCNKQNCEAKIRTKADQDPAIDVQVKPDSCVIVSVFRLNPTNLKFRVKAETSCPSFTNPDMGWLELNTADFVLRLVEGNNITVVRGSNKLELSINQGVLKTNYGILNYIQNVRVYTILGDVKYDQLTFVKKSNITDLNIYFKIGINIVEVIIVTNIPERFIFKYIK